MIINRLLKRCASSGESELVIDDSHREEFLKDVLESNGSRETILSFMLIVIYTALIGIDIFTANILGWNSRFFQKGCYIDVLLILLPFAFLFFDYMRSKTPGLKALPLKSIYQLFNFCIMLLCASMGVFNELTNHMPFIYVAALFSIASVILLDVFERITIFGLTNIVYIVEITFLQKDPSRLLEGILFSIMMTTVAIMISYINYNAYLEDFYLRKVILGEKQKLNNMYNIAEDTLKKRTDELNKALEYENLRTAFFANLSHELRTPLNIIYSAQQMLDMAVKDSKNPGTGENVRKYTHMIKQNCFRLIRLINNLIDMTKIDAGYFKVNFVNCNIVSIIEDITMSVANYVKSMGLNIVFDTEEEEKIIACDPDQMERIMLNLLSNAVKFTPVGGYIFVNIYVKNEEVIISVKDTGLGVPSEMKELIFQRFVQLDKTTSRNNEGSGIGLSIVKSLVQMHGGRISVNSEQGRGSEFIIEIPDRIAANAPYTDVCSSDWEKQKIEKINVEFSDIYSQEI